MPSLLDGHVKEKTMNKGYVTTYKGYDIYFDSKEELAAGTPEWVLVDLSCSGRFIFLNGYWTLDEIKDFIKRENLVW